MTTAIEWMGMSRRRSVPVLGPAAVADLSDEDLGFRALEGLLRVAGSVQNDPYHYAFAALNYVGEVILPLHPKGILIDVRLTDGSVWRCRIARYDSDAAGLPIERALSASPPKEYRAIPSGGVLPRGRRKGILSALREWYWVRLLDLQVYDLAEIGWIVRPVAEAIDTRLPTYDAVVTQAALLLIIDGLLRVEAIEGEFSFHPRGDGPGWRISLTHHDADVWRSSDPDLYEDDALERLIASGKLGTLLVDYIISEGLPKPLSVRGIKRF